MAEWVRALAWAGDRTVSRPGSNPATVTSLRNFGNSVYPALPVSFGGDTKSRRSLLSGVYARGSKRSHQSALECVTVVDSTTHSKKLPDPQSAIMRRKTLPCTCIGRRRRRRRRRRNCDGLTGSYLICILITKITPISAKNHLLVAILLMRHRLTRASARATLAIPYSNLSVRP